MNILCLFGIHDWVFHFKTVRSCDSDLERVYRCSRCGTQKRIDCEICEHFKFPRCIHTERGYTECYKMQIKKK